MQELVKEGNIHEKMIRDLVGGTVSSVLVQHSFPSYGLVLKLDVGYKIVYRYLYFDWQTGGLVECLFQS